MHGCPRHHPIAGKFPPAFLFRKAVASDWRRAAACRPRRFSCPRGPTGLGCDLGGVLFCAAPERRQNLWRRLSPSSGKGARPPPGACRQARGGKGGLRRATWRRSRPRRYRRWCRPSERRRSPPASPSAGSFSPRPCRSGWRWSGAASLPRPPRRGSLPLQPPP